MDKPTNFFVYLVETPYFTSSPTHDCLQTLIIISLLNINFQLFTRENLVRE